MLTKFSLIKAMNKWDYLQSIMEKEKSIYKNLFIYFCQDSICYTASCCVFNGFGGNSVLNF